MLRTNFLRPYSTARPTGMVNFALVIGISFLTLCHGFGTPFVRIHSRNSGLVSKWKMNSDAAPSSGLESFRKLLFPGDVSRREELSTCRLRLLEKVQLKQSREHRVQVEELLEKLVNLQSPGTIQENSLVGTWRLLWSSQTADVNPFQLPSKVLFFYVCRHTFSSPRSGVVLLVCM
jgi:hypothetical protein